MKLRPNDYFEFGNYLLARKNFKSFNAMMAAAMRICNGFMMLHRFGYSYQDGMGVQQDGANAKRLVFQGFDCSFVLNLMSFVEV